MIKSPLAIRVGRALCTFLVAVAVIGPAASALAANIQTDLFVYQNGDTVTVTGDGFGATETINVVTTDPNSTTVDQGTAATDEVGNFTYQFTLNANVPGLYTVTGTGETSGLTASTQFDPPSNPNNLMFEDRRFLTPATGIKLSWTTGSGGADCYYVYRSTTATPSAGTHVIGGSSCTTAPSDVYALASASPYTDTAVSTGPDYFYIVTAVKLT